jgi:hypothetical protein
VKGSELFAPVPGSDWAISLGGIAFPAVPLTLLLAYGVWLMPGYEPSPVSEVRSVVGGRWHTVVIVVAALGALATLVVDAGKP